MVDALERQAYDAVILAVAHTRFRELDAGDLRSLARVGSVFYDIKHALPEGLADERL